MPETKSELIRNFREVWRTGQNRSEQVWSAVQTAVHLFILWPVSSDSWDSSDSPGQFHGAWDLESNFWATVQSGFPGGSCPVPGYIGITLHRYSYRDNLSWRSCLVSKRISVQHLSNLLDSKQHNITNTTANWYNPHFLFLWIWGSDAGFPVTYLQQSNDDTLNLS